jgi:beta-glucosidase-like glycosyl hydrolase
LAAIQSKEHQELSLEATIKSFVLLKNEKDLLPMKDLAMKVTVRYDNITTISNRMNLNSFHKE